MLSNLLLSYTTGVDMNEACGPEAELESDEDHGNASSGKLCAKHQLGVVNWSFLVKFLSSLYLILSK